jgi:hypothetical protein
MKQSFLHDISDPVTIIVNSILHGQCVKSLFTFGSYAKLLIHGVKYNLEFAEIFDSEVWKKVCLPLSQLHMLTYKKFFLLKSNFR